LEINREDTKTERKRRVFVSRKDARNAKGKRNRETGFRIQEKKYQNYLYQVSRFVLWTLVFVMIIIGIVA